MVNRANVTRANGIRADVVATLPRLLKVNTAVYPHSWSISTGKLNFRYQSRLKNLKAKIKTFPWLSQVPQSKFKANRSRGA